VLLLVFITGTGIALPAVGRYRRLAAAIARYPASLGCRLSPEL